MKKKKEWYVVKKGRNTGLFRTWTECEAQVMGYPGAEYKGFFTKEDAEAYEYGEEDIHRKSTVSLKGKNKEAEEKNSKFEREPDPDRMTIYVDGSYMPQFHDAFSFGIVFLYQGKVTTFYKKIINAEEAKMRNVAGEIYGAEFAMNACVEKGIKEVDLYYDYLGIEKWCLGQWKTNMPKTKALKEYYDSIKEILNVHFHKVESHTGVKYNEIADQLAKRALMEK